MDGIAIAVDDGLSLQMPRRTDDEAQLPFMNPSSRNHQIDEDRARSLASNSVWTIWKIIRNVAGYITRIPFFVFRFLKGERQVREADHAPNLSAPQKMRRFTFDVEMTSIEFVSCSRLVDAEKTKENVIEVEAGHTITNALAVETEEAPCAVHVENILYKEQVQIKSHLNPPENGGRLMSTLNLVPVNHKTDASNVEQFKDNTSLVEAKSLTCILDTPPQEPNTDYFQLDAKELCKEHEFGSVKVNAIEETPALLNSSSLSSGNDTDVPKNFPHALAKRMTKYLQALESLMLVPGKSEYLFWNQTTQRRAFILATLLAIAMWARNSKHLNHAIPCIEGLAINVHLRSRL